MRRSVVLEGRERINPMPKGYEKMRDKFKREGMSDKAAKGKAARIWNSTHKKNPVTRKKD